MSSRGRERPQGQLLGPRTAATTRRVVSLSRLLEKARARWDDLANASSRPRRAQPRRSRRRSPSEKKLAALHEQRRRDFAGCRRGVGAASRVSPPTTTAPSRPRRSSSRRPERSTRPRTSSRSTGRQRLEDAVARGQLARAAPASSASSSRIGRAPAPATPTPTPPTRRRAPSSGRAQSGGFAAAELLGRRGRCRRRRNRGSSPVNWADSEGAALRPRTAGPLPPRRRRARRPREARAGVRPRPREHADDYATAPSPSATRRS